jgi:hypothetical protein
VQSPEFKPQDLKRREEGRKEKGSQVQLLKPAIPATREVEIGMILVLGQPRQKVSKTPSQSINQVWHL